MSSERPNSTTTPVAPWRGGKRNLAKRIVAIIDQVEHRTYAEPFVGMGGVFLRRSTPARAEVINDLNRDVATLFRILQRHYPQFLEVMRFQLTTRTEFERLVATDPATLTDLERAARFLYLQRTSFGGGVTKQTFGVAKERSARFNMTTLEPMLESLHERLAGVVIECLDYQPFLTRYDGPEALFYLDPPYWGNEDDYGKALFERKDFAAMADTLEGLNGRFLMSITEVPDIRDIFGAFHQVAVSTTYTAGGKGADRSSGSAKELLISNFKFNAG